VQVKAYNTRVGSGPFPTEILGQGGDLLRFAGQEFGTTTGRPRRCGWLDIVALKYCCQINGFSSLNLTKLDVLSDLPEIQLGVSYRHVDGTLIKSVPADLRLLEQLKASSPPPTPLIELAAFFGTAFFFFFLTCSHKRGKGGFELVTSASRGVVPSRLSYPLGTFLVLL
jgi:hypothetical protein